jgi:predicted TPR repeat methyltransferase
LKETDNSSTPLTLPDAVKLAIELLQKNELPRAEAILTAVLNADPNSADALHFLGILRGQQGRGQEALALLRKAVAVAPDYAEAHYNLGNVLRALGLRDEAHDAFRRTLALAPDMPEAHLNIADLLRRSGRREEAVTFYVRALELEPTLAEAHFQLGKTYYRLGRMQEAAAAFRAWQRIDPSNPVAQHMVAATGGVTPPERASDGYLRCEFDDFADTFEEVMKELRYRAPEHVAAALARHLAPRRQLDVLDAGCGTGLVAALVRPWARHITGVDLSTVMIEHASQRGRFDELIVSELTAFLQTTDKRFDLVVSADTFIYFGSLSAVFRGAGRVLRDGGHFIFSIEHLREESFGPGYFLHPHGRYSQTESYVRRCVEEAGLSVVEVSPQVIRLELKDPVEGLIVTAVKRADRKV